MSLNEEMSWKEVRGRSEGEKVRMTDRTCARARTTRARPTHRALCPFGGRTGASGPAAEGRASERASRSRPPADAAPVSAALCSRASAVC